MPVAYSLDEVKSIIDGRSNQLALTLKRSDASGEAVVAVEDVTLYLHIINCRLPHYQKITPAHIHYVNNYDIEITVSIDRRTLGVVDFRSIQRGNAVDFVGASVLSYVLNYKGRKKLCFHEFGPENGLTGRLKWRLIEELPKECLR